MLRITRINKKKRIAALLLLIIAEEETHRNRRIWTNPYLLKRNRRGMHHNLFTELLFEDPDRFRRCLRMNIVLFEDLLEKVTPFIKKQDTHLRPRIPPAERLSLTLRHLATGESQESLRLTYRIGQSTISGIIKEVCTVIIHVLRENYLRMPLCEDEWRVVANDFGHRWNFYNCVGAMDGKHFKIDPPLQSGSLYYNYKESFSVVLLAVVDAQLRFIYIDVGTNGRISDTGIWNKCSLKAHLDNNSLNIPAPIPLPNTDQEFPFVFVGDEGFPLSTKVLIPYSRDTCGNKNKRIFNYRLSRARNTSENAFGVMGARFQIFRSSMRYDPDDASKIILACCCLHNMLRTEVVGRQMYTPPEFIDEEDELLHRFRPGEWRQEPALGMINLRNQGGNRHANAALKLRDEWCNYFNGEGAVPWQDYMINK